MKHAVLIVNPRAGQGRAGSQLDLLRTLASNRPAVTLLQTRGAGQARDMARLAARDGADAVVVAGGDGTVHEVVNGLMSQGATATDRPALGIIPLGSANDLASGLGLNGTVAEGFHRALTGRPRPIDVGRISNQAGEVRYFGFSAGVGFVGAVAAERFRVRRLAGHWIYVWASLRALFAYEPRASLCVRYGQRAAARRRLMFVSINNTGSVGGFRLTPAARIDDGLFDVLSVGYVPWRRRPYLLLLTWAGRHLLAPECDIVRVDRIEIVAEDYLPVHVDGELHSAVESGGGRLLVELLPGALQVIV